MLFAGINARPFFAEIMPKGNMETGKTSTSFPARLSKD
jgi:hypothetical protein